MSQIKKDLSIRSENIQRVYEYYRAHKFMVNRRYQRKLVWNLEEKKAFVDSINKGYPVPLFLLAEVEYESEDKFEIIDGMQRLNSMMSFIDQEFDYEGRYFDLETMVETKLALDNKEIIQKEPRLDRETCARIASYVLPLSVYKNKSSSELDEIFRRINSGGRLLSRQEIRQSGSTGNFATTVRKIASNIRGDVSVGDNLSLNSMKEISITNKNLSYGINVDDIFWVSQNILRREKVRESKDEELIADILGYILADPGSKPSSRADFIDNYYGITEIPADKERLRMVETNLAKRTPEIVIQQFMNVFEALKKTLYEAGKTFNSLINKDQPGVPRHFQAIFLAYYELLIEDNKVVQDYKKLALKLNGVDKYINVYKGGGKWPADAREKNVQAVKGILLSVFRNRKPGDLALNSWTIELENILMQSFTEQSLYDFKQGFHGLDDGIFNEKLLSKVIKTLTAMANCGPDVDGYIIVGIANDKADSDKISRIYSIIPTTYNKFYITGIQSEANKYHKDLEKYHQRIIQLIEKEPIIQGVRDEISSQSRIIKYFDKAVMVFHIKSGMSPILYNKKYYIRKGPNISEVEVDGIEALMRKFILGEKTPSQK